ncbi:hypothetical protein HDV00_011256 [Rhizophlyctis rosea]|nr:hypothetical protein HDV00_011256 [Rhizophlyctis rosea]
MTLITDPYTVPTQIRERRPGKKGYTVRTTYKRVKVGNQPYYDLLEKVFETKPLRRRWTQEGNQINREIERNHKQAWEDYIAQDDEDEYDEGEHVEWFCLPYWALDRDDGKDRKISRPYTEEGGFERGSHLNVRDARVYDAIVKNSYAFSKEVREREEAFESQLTDGVDWEICKSLSQSYSEDISINTGDVFREDAIQKAVVDRLKKHGLWEAKTDTKKFFTTVNTFVSSAVCTRNNDFSLTEMLLFGEAQDKFEIRANTLMEGQCLMKAMRNA